MTTSNQPNWIVLGIAALAVILGIFVMATNWATGELLGGGASFEVDYTLFGSDGAGNDFGWYDSDYDDADGIGLIRSSMPIVLVGLVALLAGVVLTAIPPSLLKPQRVLSGGVLAGAGAVLLVGTLLFTIGISQMLSDFKDQAGGVFDWSIGVAMIFSYIVSVLALGAGVLAFIMKSGPILKLGIEAAQKA